MGIIYFFEELLGKIIFSIGEYQFEGIRPVRYLELPWKTNMEMNKFMKDLETENTTYSYKKFIRWEEEMKCQKMHINFSRSFLYLVAAIILLLISSVLILNEINPESFIVLSVSMILFFLSIVLKLRVKKIFRSIGFSRIIYDQFETWPE